MFHPPPMEQQFLFCLNRHARVMATDPRPVASRVQEALEVVLIEEQFLEFLVRECPEQIAGYCDYFLGCTPEDVNYDVLNSRFESCEEQVAAQIFEGLFGLQEEVSKYRKVL